MGTSLLGDSGHPFQPVGEPPFLFFLEWIWWHVMAHKWNANDNLLLTGGNLAFIWGGHGNAGARAERGSPGKWRGDWSDSMKAARALSPPAHAPPPRLPPPPTALHLPSVSCLQATAPLIWNSGDGSGRFIKVDKWTQELGITADPSDYGNSRDHVCPLAKPPSGSRRILHACLKRRTYRRVGRRGCFQFLLLWSFRLRRRRACCTEAGWFNSGFHL